MSVGGQFRRIGEIGVALALWRSLFWIFLRPKRILIFGLGFILFVVFIVVLTDTTNKKHFVNVEELILLDKPFGQAFKTLEMNDSLIFLKEMGDNWAMVLVGDDTLYFDNKYDYTMSSRKIETTPFTMEKALKNQIVKLNHPDGYFDAYPRMLKNGDEITIIDYSMDKREIKFKVETSSFLYLSIDFVTIDWVNLKERYPRVDFDHF